MPGIKPPTREELKIAREAAQYRDAMAGVFERQGLSPSDALVKAAEATDQQVAMRMQELEKEKRRAAAAGRRIRR